MHPENSFFIVTTLSGISSLLAAACVRWRTPKQINSLYGYRSRRSKASQENWDFAQEYSIHRMLEVGVALTLVGLVDLFLPPGPEWLELSLSLSLGVAACFYIFYTTENAMKQRIS